MKRRKTKTRPRPKTPAISASAEKLRREIADEYEIHDSGGQAILRKLAEAQTRFERARADIDRDGQTLVDRFGQLRAHPLLAVERDARAQVLAAIHALNLDVIPSREKIGRPGGR